MSSDRRVSFSDGAEETEHLVSPPKGTQLRPALKTGSSSRKPDPELYQHPDPLIRRLRLYDGHGKPVDLKRSFRDVKVVAFYFSSQLAQKASKDYDRVSCD